MKRSDHHSLAEADLTALIDTLPLAACWLEQDWTCRHCNPAFSELFGPNRNPSQPLNSLLVPLVPVSANWAEAYIVSCRGEISPQPLTASVVRTDGRIRQIVMNSRCVSARLIATFTDITGLKIPNELPSASEEMYRLSFEWSKDAIFWANAENGILVNCNCAAEALLEMPRNEIIGKHQSFLHLMEMRANFVSRFNMAASPDFSGGDSEAIVVTSSGKRVPVHIKHSVMCIGTVPVVQGIFRDITEQKHADTTLKDAHTLLQKTLDSLNEAVFIVETGTRVIQDINVTAEKMFGYRREELIGRTTGCLHVNDEMYLRFADEMLRSYERCGYYETLFQMRRQDDTIFDSEHSVTPIRNEQGQIIRHVCVVRDISERVRAQQAQRKIVQEQSAILDNSCIGITLTKNREIIWTNNRFDEMFGYAKGELHGQSVSVLYPSDGSYEKAGKATYSAIVRGEQYESELTLVRKDGMEFWAKYYGKAIDPSNLSEGSIWIVEDISLRKSMEQALADKTQQLESLNSSLEQRICLAINALKQKDDQLFNQTRLLVDLAPDAILVVDVGSGMIIDANTHAEKLFECCREELFATTPLSFYAARQPDGVPPEVSFYQNGYRVLNGEALNIERVIVSRKGHVRTCEVRLVRMSYNGRHLIRASIIDITERKMIEDELARALETARDALEEQKQFAGLLSHELRTPLAIIDGTAQLLSLSACKDSECLRQSERIRIAARRIIDLVDMCLTEDRLTSSGWELEIRAENVSQLLHDVVARIQSATPRHNIVLECAELPVTCSCDAGLVTVMLTNLLDNAVKYSPQGGDVTLCSWCEKPGFIHLMVSDQGIGFDPALSTKIFERFYRTWQVPGIPGAGLGLHLVKKIAELHQGGVEAFGQPGQGARFTVWIRTDS